jgi:hypothetical protein
MKAAFRLAGLLLLVSSTAIAGGQGAGSEWAAFTDADLNLYVDDTAGNDANDCTAPGASACATIQGALDKVPKRLRHIVTITVGPGNYAGFVVEGFEVEPAWRTSGAGMIIQGSTQPASLTMGTTAGTVFSCIRGGLPDPNTHSTLTDPNQNWKSGELRGRKLCLTSGAAKDQCLAVEDNTNTVITVAGYWADFHADWNNCSAGDLYAITDPATHLMSSVALRQGIGGRANGQAELKDKAAIIVSNVHGGASATAGNGQAADNFQILIKDFDVVAQDWPRNRLVHSVAYVDSSDHVGFKHFTVGVNSLNHAEQHPGLYAGPGLFVFRNSTAWTVQSSYANGDVAPSNSPSSPMISCSRFATGDAVIGVFGNVVDNMPAYFGDYDTADTLCASSVYFGGESIRKTGGSPVGPSLAATSLAAIKIESASRVHFVGTQIYGSRLDENGNPFKADCVRLGGDRRVGFGVAYFEGGNFANCSEFGINIAGNWNATFINAPTTSFDPTTRLPGPNGEFGIVAAMGAKILGLVNVVDPKLLENDPNRLQGKLGDLSFDGPNHASIFSYSDVWNAPGQTITDPQRGGLFSVGNGEATTATSAVPPNWISFGQGVVYGFKSVSDQQYNANNWDHVIGMSNDAPRTVNIPGKRPAGSHYVIIDISGAVDAGHTITVVPSLGRINSASNAVITPGTNRALELVSDGTDYWIISLR